MSFPETLPLPRTRPPMEAPPMRWGILGLGWIAAKFVESVQAQTRQTIAAVGSRSPEAAERFAAAWQVPRAYGSYEALVAADDIDIIYVATPHNLHHEHALLAIAAGKHVLVEKPVALNHAQAAEMVAAAQAKGVFFAEALWTYFLPKFDVIRQVLDAGVIGDILSVYTEYGEYLPREHRIFDATLAGGPLLDLGTYPVSLLAKLLGTPERIVGLATPDPAGVNGQLAVVVSNAHGALGTMATSPYGFSPTNAAIMGSRGTIRFETEFHLPGSFDVWSLDGTRRLRYEEPRGAHFEGLFHEAAEIAWAISEGKRETACRPVEASLSTMRLLDGIRHALGIDFTQAGLVE
ncbi:oxidoreductase [Rhizobium sp. Leaf384]|uniref:Gfo/Idh/MocA family protein n=1 Tax=unclassified Rhizobium TaxID=2613769 RepID=UPI0007130804|nr:MULTISPECIES: Gfo/Idh/MocA family oxidoreductase [unclassified Rhizobium]KQS78986.1 oxidoreductase [Rhizobium sp. Leaf384]KQS82624.1 oxidoreductase [Rhizobium sp. Leaf383]